jgi:hypothetical protein
MTGVIAPLGAPSRPAATPPGQADGRRRSAAVGAELPRTDETKRPRFRMDEAYRAYKDATHTRAAGMTDIPRPGLRKISSADLLASMIHQMGGALNSYTKGMFVDIAV